MALSRSWRSKNRLPRLLCATSLSLVTASVCFQSASLFCQYDVWMNEYQLNTMTIATPVTAKIVRQILQFTVATGGEGLSRLDCMESPRARDENAAPFPPLSPPSGEVTAPLVRDTDGDRTLATVQTIKTYRPICGR